jgi:hypothetical protein
MTGPGSMLKSKVPVEHRAECGPPGFIDIDLVGHGGGEDNVLYIPHRRPRGSFSGLNRSRPWAANPVRVCADPLSQISRESGDREAGRGRCHARTLCV